MLRSKLAQLGPTKLSVAQNLPLWRHERGLCRDWLRLVINGLEGTGPLGLELLAICQDGNLTTFDLPVPPDRPIDVTLNITTLRPTHLELRVSDSMVDGRFEQLQLESCATATVFARAFMHAPKAMTAVATAWIQGRKVRARNGFQAIVSTIPAIKYDRWRHETEAKRQAEIATLAGDPDVRALCDRIAIVRRNTKGWQQLQQDNSCSTVQAARETSDTETDLVRLLTSIDEDWIWLLDTQTSLANGAMLLTANGILEAPEKIVLYGDYDELDGEGRNLHPRFCPDWNPELYWAKPYFHSFAVKRSALIAALDCTASLSAPNEIMLALAASHAPQSIKHISRILSHRQQSIQHNADDTTQWCATVAEHLDPERAYVALDAKGSCRVQWLVDENAPRVSLIVPTRDRLDLLQPCVDSLLFRTDYPDLEVIIADNGSSEPSTLAYFARLNELSNVRIAECPGPFNFAAINNRAAETATGTILGFINNDIETKHNDWLREMAGWALQPNVGAVGARLLYPNGLIQHAGVVFGLRGAAGHIHRFFDANHPGFMNRLQCHQQLSAVTAACMLVERAKFDQVGGFDENRFPVNYNDIDLCLRLRGAGYRTIWTPYAELWHKETASRARSFTPERMALFARESAALQERWGAILENDPHYNSNLTRQREDVTLSVPKQRS